MRRSPFRSLVTLLAAQALLLALFMVPARAAAPIETDTWAAMFQVDLANNNMFGGGWIAGTPVTLTIWEDATDLAAAPIFQTDLLMDGTNNFSADFSPSGYDFDLSTGMGFAVSGDVLMWNPNTQQDEATPVTKVLTDTWVELTSFDVDADVISGVGATPNGFHVCAGGEWAGFSGGCGYDDQPATGLSVAGDGTWTWDASQVGVDLASGVTNTQAGGQDWNGDIVGSDARNVPWPHLYVHHPYAVQAQGFFEPTDEGFQVSMTATWPGEGPTQLAGTVDTDGNANFSLENRSLEPGTYLEFTGPRPAFLAGTGDVTRTMTITPPAITGVDLDTSSIVGTAAPETHLMLYPIEDGPGWARRHVVSDVSGTFSQQFSVPGDELPMEEETRIMTPGGAVMVEEWDADFDITNVWQPNTVLNPVISVNPDSWLSNGQVVDVFGSGFPPTGIQLIQCANPAQQGNCDLGTLQGPITGADGGPFHHDFTVSRYLHTIAGPTVDCGTDPGCVIVAFTGNGEVSASAPISFLPPLELALWVSPKVTVSSVSGRATVSGTVSCSFPGSVPITGDLWQRIGRKGIAHGTFAITVPCDGINPASWSVTLTPTGTPTLPFTKGWGEVSVSASMDRIGDHADDGWVGAVALTVPKVPKK